MTRRANLTKCRFCGRLWSPPAGATPLHYCRACSKECQARAKAAHAHLTTMRIGNYLLNIDTSELEGDNAALCPRCNTNEAGAAGVCEPCFDAWLKKNEAMLMHPYGAINGFPDPLIPSDAAPESTPPRFQRHQWPALPLWPKPRTGGEQLPLEGQILVWVDGLNEWRTACMCVAYDDPDFPLPLEPRRYYMVDGDREERGFNITPELIWMPLPPAPEGNANA